MTMFTSVHNLVELFVSHFLLVVLFDAAIVGPFRPVYKT